MAARKFLLVRHGRTKLNNEVDTSVDRIRGWMDVPLSTEGRKDVERMADGMRAGPRIDVIVCSDLARALDTATMIRDRLGVPQLFETMGLRPWDLGKLAGQTTAEALPTIEDYVRNRPDAKVPGGESFNDFRGRAFDHFFATFRGRDEKLGIALVTHHRVERLIKAWQKAGCPANLVVDIDEFLKRGEPTAHAEEMAVDLPGGYSTALRDPEGKPAKKVPPLPAASLGIKEFRPVA